MRVVHYCSVQARYIHVFTANAGCVYCRSYILSGCVHVCRSARVRGLRWAITCGWQGFYFTVLLRTSELWFLWIRSQCLATGTVLALIATTVRNQCASLEASSITAVCLLIKLHIYVRIHHKAHGCSLLEDAFPRWLAAMTKQMAT